MFDSPIVGCVICALKTRRSPFTYNCHYRVGSGKGGLYAFWCNRSCLYVGMSGDIARRIYQHRMTEHNPMLERFFGAFAQEIELSYVALNDISGTELRRLERKTIRILRPIANKAHNHIQR